MQKSCSPSDDWGDYNFSHGLICVKILNTVTNSKKHAKNKKKDNPPVVEFNLHHRSQEIAEVSYWANLDFGDFSQEFVLEPVGPDRR